MELIADILLVAGALGAGLYCFVLARRLKRFTDLEKGVGGAVSVLSAQADELKSSLESARTASDQSGRTLENLTQRAEAVAQRLELMMASMHDVIPEEPAQKDIPSEAQQDAQVPPTHDEEDDEISHIASDAPAETDVTAEAKSDGQVKAPEGIMFFRHAPAQGGQAQ